MFLRTGDFQNKHKVDSKGTAISSKFPSHLTRKLKPLISAPQNQKTLNPKRKSIFSSLIFQADITLERHTNKYCSPKMLLNPMVRPEVRDSAEGDHTFYFFSILEGVIAPIGNCVRTESKHAELRIAARAWNKEVIIDALSLCPKDSAELEEWIREAEAEYCSWIEPGSATCRISDSDFLWWERHRKSTPERETKDLEDLILTRGFTPFLTLKRVLISEISSTIRLCFDCPIEDYLSEYGFGLVKEKGQPARFMINEWAAGYDELGLN